MKSPLFFLSVLIHFILIFSLSLYILKNKPEIVNLNESNQTLEDKNISNIMKKLNVPSSNITKELNETALDKNISDTKVLVNVVPIIELIKEKYLIHIDFDKRLQELHAKVGNHIFIRIFKKESILEVWIKVNDTYKIFKKYPICAYSGDLGPKLKEGDGQAPEGFYKVKKYLLNPNSSYHLSFNLGYPNAYDKSHKRTGSYLMVHGECVSIGCYAMTNTGIEEIYKLVSKALYNKQKYIQVHAFPFYMNDNNMAQYENNKWYEFWTELKIGYDYFESERLAPKIKVKEGHYIIHESDRMN